MTKLETWWSWMKEQIPSKLFWTWNVIFIVFVTFGLLPTVLVHLIGGAVRGDVPPDFAIFALALALIPPVSVAIAVKRFRGQQARLFKFFYGVEGPLMAICLFRLFLFRELTPATTHLGILALVGITWYFVSLWRGARPYTSKVGHGGALALHTMHMLVGAYLGLLLAFFLPPFADGFISFLAELPTAIWRTLYSMRLEAMFFAGVGIPLMIFTGTLLLGLPAALMLLSFFGWRDAARGARPALLVGVTAAVVAANVAVFVFANRQPQRAAFDLLEMSASTPEARARLIAKAPAIRRGLMNAYLGPYRYLATRGEANGLADQYRRIGLSAFADGAQKAFNSCAAPFLYDGQSMYEEVRKAEKLYEEFFDEPIQQAERAGIRHALASTYDRSQIEAGLVDRDAEIVLVEDQKIAVTEHGEYADVELYEVYLNETSQQQEILYHFALPETAVITGVWLGDTADRKMRFPFQVAGKGAAQKVYRQEMARREDPALLEQVGPSSYRLRVFPIPPRALDFEKRGQEPRMHLWLTYRTFRDDKGAWPLPSLVEKRNAFWKAGDRDHEGWLPASIAAKASDPGAKDLTLALGGVRLAAHPLKKASDSLRGMKVGVLVDSSGSMRRHTAAVDRAVARIKQRAHGDGADVTVVEPARHAARFYGNASPRRQLHDFLKQQGGATFDAIVMVTDDNGFERREEDLGVTALAAPLWLVHVGKELPPAVDDKFLLPWLASGGGGAVSADEALDRIASDRAQAAAARAAGETFLQSDGRYAWRATTPLAKAPAPGQGDLAAFGAARYIRARLSGPRGLEDNRRLNEIAATHAVVTPLSSMIVLVNDRQRQALAAAAAQADAFDTTAETGKELLTTPFASISATPEPEEWLLIMIAVAFLLYTAAKKRDELLARFAHAFQRPRF